MEVSGARKKTPKTLSLSHSSADDFEYSCQSCNYEGNVVEAEGFCQNCQEYLCAACIRYHRKAAHSRRHVLLNKTKMPKGDAKQKETLSCTEICQIHAPEVIKFICTQHDVVGCGDCIVLWHKNCKVDYIPDIAKNADSTDEYHFFLEKMEALENKVELIDNDLQQKGEGISKANNSLLEDIRNKRQMLNEYLDSKEQELIAQSELVKNENKKTEDNLKGSKEKLETELKSVRSKLNLHSEQACDLYVVMKQAKSSLKALEQDLDSVSCNARLKTCLLRQGASNINLTEWKPFGQLTVESNKVLTLPLEMHDVKPEKLTARFAMEIANVRTQSNDTVCDISGMTYLSRDILAFVDRCHNSVKLLNAKQDKVLAELVLTSEITDITRVTKNTAAVTLPKTKIIILVEESFIQHMPMLLIGRPYYRLTKGRTIAANGECNFIDYSNNKFVVSYENPVKVEILNLDGQLLSSIKTDSLGNEMFERPTCVAFGYDTDSVYVSDSILGGVLKITCDGRKLAVYKDSHLSSPSGMAVLKNGTVLVADSRSESIHHMTSACRKIKILIKDDLILPSSICLDEDNRTLYISHDYYSARDFLDMKIRVYQLIPTVKFFS